MIKPVEAEGFYDGSYASTKHWVTICQTFSRQVDAYEAFDRLPRDEQSRCKVFSFEAPSTGKRQFLLSDLNSFYRQYNGVDGEHRHVYELIRHTFPCRLYFDLEFSIPLNPGIDGQTLMMQWIRLVLWKLYEYYDVCAGLEHVAVLDSSSSEKFSKHLHFLLPSSLTHKELLFSNNLEVGQFVQRVIHDITTDRGEPIPQYSSLWLCAASDHRTCIVDLGVYTRNRAFRLFNCCKWTGTDSKPGRRLVISPKDRQVFALLRGLATSSRPIRNVLQGTFIVPADVLLSRSSEGEAVAGSAHGVAEAGGATFQHFATHFNRARYSLLPPLRAAPALPAKTRPLAAVDDFSLPIASAPLRVHEISRSSRSGEASPFPSLDSHVLRNYAQRGGMCGTIAHWSLSCVPRGGLRVFKLRYGIAGNRFCECVGRAHKSNGVFFEANLSARELRQGCWDVDCRGFAFPLHAIPEHVLPLGPEDLDRQLVEMFPGALRPLG
eukprot:gene32068-38780_t